MSIPERTDTGIVNEILFYRGQYLVYVEGPEDIPFWGTLFPEWQGHAPHLKAVGGRDVLQRYEVSLASDDKKSIVARDSDFDNLLGIAPLCPRVVVTGYYSIENVFMCPCRLARWIGAYCALPAPPLAEVLDWLNKYDAVAYWLLAADLIAFEKAPPVDRSFARIERYLKKDGALDEDALIAELIKAGFSKEQLEGQRGRLVGRPARYYFRGHCLLSAMRNFATAKARMAKKKGSVSEDQFVAGVLSSTSTCGRCDGKWGELKLMIETAVGELTGLVATRATSA